MTNVLISYGPKSAAKVRFSAGSSIYPLEALQRAGVDLTDPAPVDAAFGVLAEIVDRLEALVEKGLPA